MRAQFAFTNMIVGQEIFDAPLKVAVAFFGQAGPQTFDEMVEGGEGLQLAGVEPEICELKRKLSFRPTRRLDPDGNMFGLHSTK